MTFILHHSFVESDQPSAKKTAFVLHGALGSGQNFRGIIRQLCQRLPHFAFVLVDLRNHGKSHPAPPPQNLSSSAHDLHHLDLHLRSVRPELEPVSVVLGHSFGGKVAIEYARLHPERLEQVWVLDSNPGRQTPGQDHEIGAVIRAVRAVPQPIPTRAAAVESLMNDGMSSGLANWMTTNLQRVDDHYDWVFDLPAIEELLVDYFERDLWDYLEQPRQAPRFELVVAERSDRWVPTMKTRAQTLPAHSCATFHLVPNAGHWLHVDNPQALLTLLGRHMPAH